ncbi:diphthamide synthesis protein [Candidatus Woesearchaeota archaeon]|nr:diphthamide synthesis protein [Candidatus Woesearchaeota archaeon]
MKTYFVEAKYDKKVTIPKNVLDKVPKKIMLFMTAQLIEQKDSLIKQLEKAGKKVLLTKPRHTMYEGQLLGCDTEKVEGDFEAFFYIGDGMFHPEALIIKNDKPVHIYNQAQKKYSLLTKKDADMTRKRLAAAKSEFVISKNIGVLVTTKQGQNKLRLFEKIKEKYPDKEFYFLVNNNVEFDRLEDFPFIECFVNTACERIAYGDYKKFTKPVINFEDLL